MITFIKSLFKEKTIQPIVLKNPERTIEEVLDHIHYLRVNNYIECSNISFDEVCTFADLTPQRVISQISLDEKYYTIEGIFQFKNQLMRLEELEIELYNNLIDEYLTSTGDKKGERE